MLHHMNLKRIICFTNSKEAGIQLHKVLLHFIQEFKLTDTVTIEHISKDIAPKERNKLVSGFNSGKITMLISSDLLARGMDLKVILEVTRN
jgi:superfamily II DNA/RNA helicase